MSLGGLSNIRILLQLPINADTDLTPYDTGTFVSAGTVVAGQAVALATAAFRDNILDLASGQTGVAACRLEGGDVVCGERRIALPDLHRAGTAAATASKRTAMPISRRAPSPSMSRASVLRCIA